jgi:hypothetical protein
MCAYIPFNLASPSDLGNQIPSMLASNVSPDLSSNPPLTPPHNLSWLTNFFHQEGIDQRGIADIDWVDGPPEGTPENPVHVMEAWVQMIRVGTGRGYSESEAKEDAATQAIQAMGLIESAT